VPEHPREIHTLLFADVVGYSHLQEHDVPLYLYEFLTRVSRRLKDLPTQPEFVNTWGDALFAVMSEARPMVAYALALQAAVKAANAEIQGMPHALSLRVGLHAGPVYPGIDPFTGASNFYGSHVNRAARLEPVTLPGHVYATEQFVALLNAECEAARDFPFAWEYVGQLALAKNFGAQAVYHVLRA
jgi:class 3 adenylate cyclase